MSVQIIIMNTVSSLDLSKSLPLYSSSGSSSLIGFDAKTYYTENLESLPPSAIVVHLKFGLTQIVYIQGNSSRQNVYQELF